MSRSPRQTRDRGLRAAVSRAFAVAAVTSLMLVAAPAAFAHPYLVASTPQAGVVASSVPKTIQIAFTERLVLQGCSITVRNAQGRILPIGKLRTVLGGDGLQASVANFPEGIYTVNWVALGNDGHTVAGSYQLGTPGPNGQAPAGADKLLATTNLNGTEHAPTESFVSIAGRWLAAVAAFVLLGGAALLFRLGDRIDPEVRDRATARWRALALPALAVAVVGTLAEALERAHGPKGFNFQLLTASTSGTAVLARLGILLVAIAGLRAVKRDWRAAWLGGAGGLTLASLAVDGHVVTLRTSPALAAVGMIVHLLSAGVWVGGVIVLAACVAPVALSARKPAEVLAAGRAFSPVAAVAAVLTIITGLIAAVEEVARWYFLRWSTYGHLLIVKGSLVVIVLALGATTTWVARRALRGDGEPASRRGRLSRSLLAGEAVLGIGIIFVATTLAGTLQGRGQPLPSQRGNLLPGAGFADVALQGSIADMTLAPARPGLNRIVVAFASPFGSRGTTPPALPRNVSVALSCACGGAQPIGIKATLRPGSGGADAWYADVGLPLNGVWTAQLRVNNEPTVGSPTFTLGSPPVAGSTPLTVASVADLSGPDAIECRSQEIGALMSIEVMNLVGGVDGRKITQEVLDDGGSPAVARSEALQLAAQHPVAFLAPCGQAASAAIQAVGNRIPTIVADSNVPVTQGADVFRFAANPYAEGYASGQYIGEVGLKSVPKSTPRRVAALVENNPDSQQRLKGLEQGLARYGIKVQTFPPGGPGLLPLLRRLIPESEWLGIYLDGQFTPLTNALRELGPEIEDQVNPTAILTSSRLASEDFIEASGELGREGQVRSITDVDPTTSEAESYATFAPQIIGELPTLPGLSGFVAGQALAYGLIGGTSADAISDRLRTPGVFSQAAISPWSDRDPASGTLMFRVFLPEFLTDNLIPVGPGMPGEVADGQFFPDGDWEAGASTIFTPLPVNLGGSSITTSKPPAGSGVAPGSKSSVTPSLIPQSKAPTVIVPKSKK